MGIIYQTDKRSGITYAYENQSFWDPELKRSCSSPGSLNRPGSHKGNIERAASGRLFFIAAEVCGLVTRLRSCRRTISTGNGVMASDLL